MKKKIQIFKNAIKSLNKQFIGSRKDRGLFVLTFYSHYIFKNLGLKNPVKFPAAQFNYQNIVLNTRPNTIDFWACLESYEPDLTYFLMEVIKEKRGTFIDVGGHIGRFTTLMAKNNWEVITFEPMKSNHQALVNNLIENDCAQNAEVFNIGLGDVNKKQTIYFNPQEMGESSLVDTNNKTNQDEIQIVKFDDFMHGRTFHDVCVVKIDIEGNEERAIEGMKEFINNNKPLMVIELWNAHSKNLIPYLESMGYTRLHIFWYIKSKHTVYMDEMKALYNRSQMFFTENGNLIRN